MTVAFNDVVIFRDLYADLPSFANLDYVMATARKFYARRRTQQSFVVNVMSMALYRLFAADDGLWSTPLFYCSLVQLDLYCYSIVPPA